jgi:hypothetical protein
MTTPFWRGFEKRAWDSGQQAAASAISGAFGGGSKAAPPPPPPPAPADTGSLGGNISASISRAMGR